MVPGLGWRRVWGMASMSAPPPVRAQAKVYHYRISTAADGGLYLQKGCLFPSLEALLTYYQAHWDLIHNPLLQPCVRQVGCPRPAACPSLGQAHPGGGAGTPYLPHPPVHSAWGPARVGSALTGVLSLPLGRAGWG